MSVEAETAGMSPYKGSKPKFWGVLHRECCCFVRGSWQRKREEPMRNDTGRLRAPTTVGRDGYALDSHAPRPTGPYPPQPTRTVCTRKPCGAWEDVITGTPAAIRRPGEQRSSPGRTSRSMPRAGCRSADGSPISAYRQQRAGPGGAAPRGAGLQLFWQPVYFTDTPSWARAFRRIEGSDEHGDPAGCPRRRELSRPLSR